MAPALRVVIGEDDVLLREGIARLLEDAGLDVVAQSGDAEHLLRRALAHRPDVAIVDVQMPPRRENDGLLAAIELRHRLPETGVMILSQYCEPSFALELIGDRPEGVEYLLKERLRRRRRPCRGRGQRARPRGGRPHARALQDERSAERADGARTRRPRDDG